MENIITKIKDVMSIHELLCILCNATETCDYLDKMSLDIIVIRPFVHKLWYILWLTCVMPHERHCELCIQGIPNLNFTITATHEFQCHIQMLIM